jgi:23S rRNA pseudouridine2605 synthase
VNRKRGSGGRRRPAGRVSSASKPAGSDGTSPDGEKLQKVLARAGLGSRREMEHWIEAGRISVDGKVASLGDRVQPDQLLRVDGKLLESNRPQRPRVIMYHKPEGEICSRNDPEKRPSVFDHLPRIRNGRWINIGRLDFNTSGLLLFSNDGELVNALTHPSLGIEREYAVRVKGVASEATLKTLQTEIMLDDGPAHFTDIVDGGGEGENHWYYVVIMEGRYREVRRMWEAVGHPVTRLIRTRYGPIILPRRLHKSKRQELEPEDIKLLYDAAGLVYHEPKGRRRPGAARRTRR